MSGWRAHSLGCKADKFTSGGCSVCEPAAGEKRPFPVESGANDTNQHFLALGSGRLMTEALRTGQIWKQTDK